MVDRRKFTPSGLNPRSVIGDLKWKASAQPSSNDHHRKTLFLTWIAKRSEPVALDRIQIALYGFCSKETAVKCICEQQKVTISKTVTAISERQYIQCFDVTTILYWRAVTFRCAQEVTVIKNPAGTMSSVRIERILLSQPAQYKLLQDVGVELNMNERWELRGHTAALLVLLVLFFFFYGTIEYGSPTYWRIFHVDVRSRSYFSTCSMTRLHMDYERK